MSVPETYSELLDAADKAHDDMNSNWLCMLVVRMARMMRQMEDERVNSGRH